MAADRARLKSARSVAEIRAQPTFLLASPSAAGHEIAAVGELAKRPSAQSSLGNGEGFKVTAP
jgi:hypothetical protein